MTDPTLAEPAPYQPAPYQPAYGAAQPAKSATLGKVSLLLALAVFVLSIAASVLIGVAAAPFADTRNGLSYYTNYASSDPAEVAVSLASTVQPLLGTLIGVTALVLAIVATASNRGRRFGIPAMIIAFMAPGLSLVTFFVAMASSISR